MACVIDWRDYLNPEHVDVPLHVLRYTCTERISWYLNKEVQLRPGMRHKPNFGGLGELIGFDGLEISEMSRRQNPGLSTLELWKQRRDLAPTIGNFVKHLATLGRQDILTDMQDLIRDEIKVHLNKRKNLELGELQDETVTSALVVEETNRILTIHDVNEGRTIYDAFICFDTADMDFVKAMLAKLEDPRKYGFRFFVPGRDNLVGTNSNDLTTKIISERCRHMVVIISKSFLKSPACEFQISYAVSLNPGARDKKIVPIKVEECRIPDVLQIMACCDFTNSSLLDWCWDRLAMSIMCPMPHPDFIGPQRFVPPYGSALGTAFSETGGASFFRSRSSLDSGIFSRNSSGRNGPVTAPVCSPCPQPSTSLGCHSNTVPVMATPHQHPVTRDGSPGTVRQAFKRIQQTFTPSKIHQKKHKTTNAKEFTASDPDQ